MPSSISSQKTPKYKKLGKKEKQPKPFDFELLAMPVVGVSRALSNSPQD